MRRYLGIGPKKGNSANPKITSHRYGTSFHKTHESVRERFRDSRRRRHRTTAQEVALAASAEGGGRKKHGYAQLNELAVAKVLADGRTWRDRINARYCPGEAHCAVLTSAGFVICA